MSKVLTIFLCLIFTFWSFPQTSKVFAETTPPPCSDNSIGVNVTITYTLGTTLHTLTDPNNAIPEGVSAIFFNFKGISQPGNYRWDSNNIASDIASPSSDGSMMLRTNDPSLIAKGNYPGWLRIEDSTGRFAPYCSGIDYHVGHTFTGDSCELNLGPIVTENNLSFFPTGQTITATISQSPTGTFAILFLPGDYFTDPKLPKTVEIKTSGNGRFTFQMPTSPSDNAVIYLSPVSTPELFCKTNKFIVRRSTKPIGSTCTPSPANGNIDITSNIFVTATNLTPLKTYAADLINKNTATNIRTTTNYIPDSNNTINKIILTPPALPEGSYAANVFDITDHSSACTADFNIGPLGALPGANVPVKKCGDGTGDTVVCANAQGEKVPGCTESNDPTKPNPNPGIATAIGCIHTNPAEFVKDFLKFIIAISGGLAFLLMLLGAYQMLTSAGNPDHLNAGKDRLASAIIGLLFIIFAVLLMQIIGVHILEIPGFK